MTTTERLRELLDEHGVEHDDVCDMTLWNGADGCAYTAIEMVPLSMKPSKKLMVRRVLTPEQAIAATLGTETCQQEEGGWSTEGDHARVWLTCGHDCMVETVADLPSYCPVCGRRVMSE